MKQRSKTLKSPSKKYFERAKELSNKDAERLMSRMRGRFTHRLEDKKFTVIEALALQLEFEDEQLNEWRTKIADIRRKHKD